MRIIILEKFLKSLNENSSAMYKSKIKLEYIKKHCLSKHIGIKMKKIKQCLCFQIQMKNSNAYLQMSGKEKMQNTQLIHYYSITLINRLLIHLDMQLIVVLKNHVT